MDLELGFDDDDLETNSKVINKEGDLHVPYNVKICSPKWFDNNVNISQKSIDNPADTEELQNKLKFSGDYLYSKKEYLKAALKYEQVLDVLSEINVTVSQDTKESLCRCYMYCGQQKKSLDLANELVTQMSNEDEARQRQSLILLSSMCKYCEKWVDCAAALEKLIILSPYYNKFWMELGHAYMKLGSNYESFCCGDLLCSEQEYTVLALTCFIKASLLTQTSPYKVSEISLSRNLDYLKVIQEEISDFPLPDEQKAFALQWMKKDKASYDPDDKETIKKQQQEMDVVPSISSDKDFKNNQLNSKSYYEKYCVWFKNYFIDVDK